MNKKYEWIGDAESTIEAPANEHSEKYYEPSREYDLSLIHISEPTRPY